MRAVFIYNSFLPFKHILRCSLILTVIILSYSCKEDEPAPITSTNSTNPSNYSISGRVINEFGEGLENIRIQIDSGQSVITNAEGTWIMDSLIGMVTITPESDRYAFNPEFIIADSSSGELLFNATRIPTPTELSIFNWFDKQQLSNGLLESSENGNVVSLYDNALSAMVFMLRKDFSKAEKIFDFFNASIESELRKSPGGFSQFRDRSGVPGNHRWMGDNAWLLLAIKNYKMMTGSGKYDQLALEIRNWLISLQDTDGGLFAGYGADDVLLNYKVTEGNIDAFAAINGYDIFHKSLLSFLEEQRWDSIDNNLMAWPENPPYKYALDNHSWSYCAFPDYPVSSLFSADRFLNTQTATINSAQITGYDIDEDKDAVFIEGTGQMALAWAIAGNNSKADLYTSEMEKVLKASTTHADAAGFPYSSNAGTGYGNTPLWQGADTEIAISGGAWYLFARYRFNPFAIGIKSNIPEKDKFWLN